jgi:hypothetical protein
VEPAGGLDLAIGTPDLGALTDSVPVASTNLGSGVAAWRLQVFFGDDDRVAPTEFHSGRSQQGADGLGIPPLLADHAVIESVPEVCQMCATSDPLLPHNGNDPALLEPVARD